MEQSRELYRTHVIVSGRVQGVSFRYYTRDKAKKLGVYGWVRNLPDGRVEFIAEGNKANIEALIDWCRLGPSMAIVEDVEIKWEEAKGGYKDFSIRH